LPIAENVSNVLVRIAIVTYSSKNSLRT
jgi:hypothetical protein